jgi:membrane protease YdiL (CAAX protease family)
MIPFGDAVKIVILSLAIFHITKWIVQDFLGIKIGNAGADRIRKMMRETPLWAFIVCVVLAPILEELACRWFPMLFGKSMTIGVISSLIFALIHGLHDSKGNLIIPLPQFILGLVFWKVATVYDISSAKNGNTVSDPAFH